MLRPHVKTAIFFDGSNFYSTCKNLQLNPDYARILQYFKNKSDLVRAFYYTAVRAPTAEKNDPLRPLLDHLQYNGYSVITKTTKEFLNAETGVTKIKGNMDIEMAIDVLRLASRVDQMHLFTGDGDFTNLVRAVQEQGVRVSIYSSIATRPSMCADELRRQADEFIELANPDVQKNFLRMAA